jgi:hypothetical protein
MLPRHNRARTAASGAGLPVGIRGHSIDRRDGDHSMAATEQTGFSNVDESRHAAELVDYLA